jgi:hypothetical protein
MSGLNSASWPRPNITAPAAAVVVFSLLAAGCGGSTGSHVAQVGSATTATQPTVSGALGFANCMRSNGVLDYPDPGTSGGPQSLNRIDPNSPTFQAAYKACRKDLTSGGVGPPTPSAGQLRFALVFARCLRTHGFPRFPDPLTTYGSGFTLGQGMYFPDNGTYRVQSPTFVRASKACGVQLPSGLP